MHVVGFPLGRFLPPQARTVTQDTGEASSLQLADARSDTWTVLSDVCDMLLDCHKRIGKTRSAKFI